MTSDFVNQERESPPEKLIFVKSDCNYMKNINIGNLKKPGNVRLIAAGAVIFLLLILLSHSIIASGSHGRAFIAGTSKDAPVYLIGKNNLPSEDGRTGQSRDVRAIEIKRLVRGTPVSDRMESKTVNGVLYRRIDEETGTAAGYSPLAPRAGFRAPLYVRAANISSSPNDIVREKKVFVRTPLTIYSNREGPAIASFAPKGSCLDVKDYDRIDSDGSVHKYKVEYIEKNGQRGEGYVYGRYVTDTQKKADAVYNKNGVYDLACGDNYSYNLYGGSAKNLDFYPRERIEIPGNKFCADARAMYINCAAAVNCDPWVKLVKKTDCNAVVIDIKDGVLAYKSEVAKELSPRSYKTAYASEEDYKKGIDAFRDTGAYLIGRIVVFNDPLYARDHPENCIKYGRKTAWPSAYSRQVWEYNVRLAIEAVKKFGFNEIQFDYVRFPENSYKMSKSGKADFRNAYGEEKGQAVQNFCIYASDQIHEVGAYFSVDVFGESAYGYMTAYGQYWPGLSNVADAISAMPYTDHMGADGAWKHPYATVNRWAAKAAKQQERLENPAVARTWITGYDTPYWNPGVKYRTKQLKAQAKALKDAGLTGGFIPWNAGSDISKYREYAGVWKL